MIFVNFKCYEETWGEKAVGLANICKKVSAKTGIAIFPVVSPFDVDNIIDEVGIKVWIQSVDETEGGAKNGAICAPQAVSHGVSGSLLNHSEKRMAPGKIRALLGKWPNGLKSMVCIHSLGQITGPLKKLKADYIAYEPTELIGNKEKSVSSEYSNIIKRVVEYCGNTPVVVGAGIHNRTDVETALLMGAKGVLIATDVVKSSDPEAELTELAEAFIRV